MLVLIQWSWLYFSHFFLWYHPLFFSLSLFNLIFLSLCQSLLHLNLSTKPSKSNHKFKRLNHHLISHPSRNYLSNWWDQCAFMIIWTQISLRSLFHHSDPPHPLPVFSWCHSHFNPGNFIIVLVFCFFVWGWLSFCLCNSHWGSSCFSLSG